MANSIDTRFWRKVDKRNSNECWEWTGAVNSNNYGVFLWYGRQSYAHRIAAFLAGILPSVAAPKDRTLCEFVLHICDNTRCCNPAHMRAGSYKENTADMFKKQRAYLTPGVLHPNAKLSMSEVQKLRAQYAAGETQYALAEQYKISQSTVCDIVRGVSYAQL